LPAAKPQTRNPHGSDAVEVEMKNVNFRARRDVTIEIRRLRGRFETTGDGPVSFDEPQSFVVKVDSAEIAITTGNLSTLLNSYVFAYPGAPLKNISAISTGDRLKIKGTMHKGVDLPFEVQGGISATPEGDIRLHSESIKSAHLPLKGLLHLFGENLAKMVNVNETRGVRIDGDDMIMFPSRMTPPPHLFGRVTAVRLDGDKIVQTYDSGKRTPALTVPVHAQKYIYHRGGTLRFGKLTMHDSDLEIVDDNPQTPFDFFLGDYTSQLVAGYSLITPSRGLIVHMPDYGKLRSNPHGAPR
jgi:hypothetical protein